MTDSEERIVEGSSVDKVLTEVDAKEVKDDEQPKIEDFPMTDSEERIVECSTVNKVLTEMDTKEVKDDKSLKIEDFPMTDSEERIVEGFSVDKVLTEVDTKEVKDGKSLEIEDFPMTDLGERIAEDSSVDKVLTEVDVKDDKPPKIKGKYSRTDKDFESMSVEAKCANLIRQIEYYFSDRNLLSDRFLSSKIREDENGWVDIELLLTFNLLKAMKSSVNEVVEALKKSPSGLLLIDEEGKRIRRNIEQFPTVNDRKKIIGRSINRTLFVSGFPMDATECDIKEFFVEKGYTDDVQLRMDDGKVFMGSVFVTFSTVDTKEWFVNKNNSLKYNDDSSLEIKTVNEFFADRGRSESRKDKDVQKAYTLYHGTGDIKDEDESVKKIQIPFKNFILYLKGLPPHCTREILKEKFNDLCRCFADFNKGDSEGYLRFSADDEATKSVEEVLKKQKEDGIEGNEIVFADDIRVSEYKVLEGEDERKYWIDVEKRKQEYFKRCRNNRKRKFNDDFRRERKVARAE